MERSHEKFVENDSEKFVFYHSTLILYLTYGKAILLILVILLITIFISVFASNYLENHDFSKNMVGLLLLGGLIYTFLSTIKSLFLYYFNMLICEKDKIIISKIGLFKIYNNIIELYRIQRFASDISSIRGILFKIGKIIIIDQNNVQETIKRMDAPEKIISHLQKLKDVHIETRHRLEEKEQVINEL